MALVRNISIDIHLTGQRISILCVIPKNGKKYKNIIKLIKVEGTYYESINKLYILCE
jgi:hypothetical protein